MLVEDGPAQATDAVAVQGQASEGDADVRYRNS